MYYHCPFAKPHCDFSHYPYDLEWTIRHIGKPYGDFFFLLQLGAPIIESLLLILILEQIHPRQVTVCGNLLTGPGCTELNFYWLPPPTGWLLPVSLVGGTEPIPVSLLESG